MTSGSQATPKQRKKYVAHNDNKTALMAFIKNEWSKDIYANLLGNQIIYVTTESKCYKLHLVEIRKTVICNEVMDLHRDHEEADKHMFLHAKHANENGYDNIRIRIKSSDVDVEVLAIYYQISN